MKKYDFILFLETITLIFVFIAILIFTKGCSKSEQKVSEIVKEDPTPLVIQTELPTGENTRITIKDQTGTVKYQYYGEIDTTIVGNEITAVIHLPDYEVR